MKKILSRRFLLICFLVAVGLIVWLPSAFARQVSTPKPVRVKPGIDVLRDRGFDILKGKRIGLITNPTGISSDMEQTVDILHHTAGVKLVALFGPEHGVRGDVEGGKEVNGFNDSRTGLNNLHHFRRTSTREY